MLVAYSGRRDEGERRCWEDGKIGGKGKYEAAKAKVIFDYLN